MSYEFYIMSGIAVFVGCTWLYRKGKGAYMMVRKIRSAFKVVNAEFNLQMQQNSD